MDENQPKKRGRKKKAQSVVEKPITKPIEKAEIQIQHTPVKVTNELFPRLTKQQIARRLEEASHELDKHLRPENIAEIIHEKIFKRSLGSNARREEGFDADYKAIYKRIKNSEATPRETIEWQDQITCEMARRICKVLDFLLQCGPVTKIENSVLEGCSAAIKSYYMERFYLISIDKEAHLASTYFPQKDSCIFKYITEVINIPCLSDLVSLYSK